MLNNNHRFEVSEGGGLENFGNFAWRDGERVL